MESVWTQLIITVGGVATAIFFTVRYLSLQNAKREKQLQLHNEKMQSMQYEYYETKNGHMERMSKDFTNSSNRMAKAITGLTAEIKVLTFNRKK